MNELWKSIEPKEQSVCSIPNPVTADELVNLVLTYVGMTHMPMPDTIEDLAKRYHLLRSVTDRALTFLTHQNWEELIAEARKIHRMGQPAQPAQAPVGDLPSQDPYRVDPVLWSELSCLAANGRELIQGKISEDELTVGDYARLCRVVSRHF